MPTKEERYDAMQQFCELGPDEQNALCEKIGDFPCDMLAVEFDKFCGDLIIKLTELYSKETRQ